MKRHETGQYAYAGRYAIETDSGALLAGGGVTVQRPRLYETEEAVREAVAAMDPAKWRAVSLTPVLLVWRADLWK